MRLGRLFLLFGLLALSRGGSIGSALMSQEGWDSAYSKWSHRAQLEALLLNPVRPDDSFSFAVIGDAEPGRFPWQRLFSPGRDAFTRQIRLIHALNPRFILQLGDFVSKGTEKKYKDHIYFLNREMRLPVFFTIGNHDRSVPNGPADKTLYKAVFGWTDFYFDFGSWRFIILDTSDIKLRRDQLTWLKAALTTNQRKLIFTHVPPKALKGKIRGLEMEIDAPLISPGYFEEGSREFVDLASKYAVERVYMGHIHSLGWAQYQGVTYVLSGGGGSPLYPLPPGYPQSRVAHWIEVQVSSQGLKETIHTLEGRDFSFCFNDCSVPVNF